jgi:prevent-host-death family protein
MTMVNMPDAKTNLSRLVEVLESGAVQEIIIARNGKPAARLVPIAKSHHGPRIGVAKGLFSTPDPDPQMDAGIAVLFLDGDRIEPG